MHFGNARGVNTYEHIRTPLVKSGAHNIRGGYMEYVSDYRHDKELCEKFFELANEAFGLDLAGWAARGGWEEGYVCHTLMDGERMVANVSTTGMTLIIDGHAQRAFQIGTVYTRPEYRGRGCARELLERVIAEANGCGMFLFANPAARGLYEKLGFVPAPGEILPRARLTEASALPYALRRAGVDELRALAARNRVYSHKFDVSTRACLAELYLHDEYSEALYVCDEADVGMVLEREGDVMHVRALYGERACDSKRLMAALAGSGARVAEFDFMPDGWGIDCTELAQGPDDTFVMNMTFPRDIAYPGLMRA